MATTVARKSIPLDAEELSLAARIRTPGTPERDAVEAVVGPLPERMSESQALSTLIDVAATQVRQEITTQGYAALAAAQDDEDRAFVTATKARRDARATRRNSRGQE